jgi:hypothetical protein
MKRIIFISLIAMGLPAYGEDLDPASQEALKNTTQLLNSARERAEYINKNPNAKFVDNDVQALAGSQKNTDAIYGLSADILAEMAEKYKGDPQQMMQALEKAKQDPKGFAESFSEKNKANLKAVSNEITPARAPTSTDQKSLP